MFSVSEIFTSYQGEGRLTGVPSIFIRLAGCHLRCGFCDTVYSQRYSDGTPMSVENVVSQVLILSEKPAFPAFSTLWKNTSFFIVPAKAPRVTHVVISGGEPLLFPSVVPLVRTLREHAFHVTVETSGTRFLPTGCDLLSVSPKMQNSGNLFSRRDVSRTLPALIQNAGDYQLKFVIDEIQDCMEIEFFLQSYPFLCREKVLLMPQGKTAEEIMSREKAVREYAHSHFFGFSPRAHLFWFEAKRGV